MRVAIVGGGILGTSLGYFLAEAGAEVHLVERSDNLGGLVAPIELDELGGVRVDRYYHCILNSDRHFIDLIHAVGLGDHLQHVETKMGFYHDARLYPMSTPLEFLRFPPLGMLDRARLALTILACRRIKDWHDLETISVEAWLTRLSGRHAYETIWKPLLGAKFDGDFAQVPATYIWSRLVRMTDTRDGAAQKELMGYLIGGHLPVVEALAARITESGGTVQTNTAVASVNTDAAGRIRGIRTDRGDVDADAVVLTTPTGIARRLLPEHLASVADQWGRLDGYLGVILLLVVLRRQLTPYYTTNVTDKSVPFTGVIETTNLIAPEHVGGYHLVYLPKYVYPDNPYTAMDDASLEADFMGHLRRMFPDLTDDDIVTTRLFRERYVEPIHPIGGTDRIAPIKTDIPGLYLANTSQIYPALTNCDSVTRHARQVSSIVLGDHLEAQPTGMDALLATV
jgi:protoporphyrinogen oxidase